MRLKRLYETWYVRDSLGRIMRRQKGYGIRLIWGNSDLAVYRYRPLTWPHWTWDAQLRLLSMGAIELLLWMNESPIR